MLTHPPTSEDLITWHQTAAQFRPRLSPNRKSADEMASYLETRYPITASDDPRLHDVVAQNILLNKYFARKLPSDTRPATRVFVVRNEGTGAALYDRQEGVFIGSPILVGLEIHSAFLMTEGSSDLHDELVAFAGLDAADIENDFLIWEYIDCLRKYKPKDSLLMGTC
jgi:hypothetical protein